MFSFIFENVWRFAEDKSYGFVSLPIENRMVSSCTCQVHYSPVVPFEGNFVLS